ncbi:Nephrocystin-3 [Colletotrichum fructicola Nara gc5]|uniref:Nephrocystin-3 n=1 Tax=Colletotrichum fructicola (strain Nara gc5) TaxID=1213859 RepID=A0A7J6JD28_COLFN|nr:Nephrocystin-3 [Colletotrichum fructicola Nara gc5]
MSQERSRDDYKVAWICPLEVEQIAAMEMLDDEHPVLPKSPADHNVYSLGSINSHNIVIAGLHQPGNCPAATVVAQMRMTFPSLRFGLLVGIGGGVPVQTDNGMIRLGHVVVSKPAGGHSGALQYDHGKAKDGHFERIGALAPPPAVLLNAAQSLAVQRARLGVDPVQQNVRRIDITNRGLRRFQYPGEGNDHLFPPHYKHQCQGVPCAAKCDPSKRIPRTSDDDDTFVTVHRGNIASGELVVKDALLRDTLAQQDGLLCFEMEAAGANADFPCLVVRGISDYCDSHKNDMWHGYAAAVAAAYARQLFFHLPVDEVQRCSSDATLKASPLFIIPFKLPGVHSVNHFVARHEELGRLHKELKWTGERRTVILHGLGGMGKTQTTIAFAKKHRDDYSAVLWLDARDTTTLKQSYQRLAQRIMMETTSVTYIKNALSNRDLDETVSAVKRWLDEPKNNRWLMIYDNYDDVKLHNRRSPSENETGSQVGNESNAGETGSKAYDIRPFFPDTEHGAILITTRSSSVQLGKRVQLRKLADLEDSLAILASTSGRTDLGKDPDAAVLAKKLDGLPLALATAGAFLDQVATSCREYLEMYEKAWLRLQKESPELMAYDRALYSTWNVSLRYIRLQNQNAADLLRLWAYFDNHDVWYELLRAGESEKPLWLHKMTEDKLKFDNVVRVLCDHGLVEPNAAMVDTSVDLEDNAWMFQALGNLYSDQGRLQEAEDMYQRALQGSEKALGPDHTSTLLTVNNLGNLYSKQGRLQEAEDMYERALQGSEKALGPDHTSTLLTVNNLGNLYSKQGRLQEAEDMYERALQGTEKALGPDHTSTLDTVNNLGNLYSNQGQLKEAEGMYQRALQGREKALGPDHTSTLDSVHCLGILYSKQGRLQEAEGMYQRALQGSEKALGPDHTSTLLTVNNLGNLYSNQGRLKEAEGMYQRALQGSEKALGPDHTSTLDSVHCLGILYSKQGRLQEAEGMYQRALQGSEKALGPDHTSTLLTVNNLGNLYSKQGRLKEAEGMYQRALQGREKALGPDHTSTLNTVNNLGNLYSKQGRLKEAEGMYQRALQGREKALGPDHTSTLNTVNNLGNLYSKQGQLQEAEDMYERALQGYEKALGPDHTSTLNTVNNLGNLYSKQGRLQEAEGMYQRALQGSEKALGPAHTSTLNTVNNLGNLYSKQGQLQEAEDMYERALQGYEKALGPDHTSTLNTVNNLGNLYSKQGRLQEAEGMYERALQGTEKALGPDHTSTLLTVNDLGNLYSDQGRLKEAEGMYERALQGYEKVLHPDSLRTYVPALNALENLGDLFTDYSFQGKSRFRRLAWLLIVV